MYRSDFSVMPQTPKRSVLKMKYDRSFIKSTLLLSASVTLGVCGVALMCLWPVILDNVLLIHPSSLMFKFWKDIPIEVRMDFYLFNWTNSEQLSNLSVKPRLEEVGPYTFLQKEEKCNITWNDNGTVTFRQRKFWYHQENEHTKLNEDIIVTGNPIAIVASYIARNWNYYVRKGVFMTLARSGYFTRTVSQPANQMLFDGYREPLIKIASAMPFFSYLHVPQWDNFGWYYKRNGSDEADGVFNMGTGSNSVLGHLYNWDYKNRTPFFDDSCGDVVGSAGQIFPRNLKKDWLTLFSTDIRRVASLKFAGEETVNGILGYKYVGEESVLDNGTINPQNKCFCHGSCLPSGSVNISSTRFGVPIFVSFPHFYKADPYYTNLVDGMKPDPSKHELSLTIEPITGIPLKGQTPVQLNLMIQPISGTQLFEDVPKFFLPILWGAQSFEVQGFLAFGIRVLANMSTICTSAGILMIIASIILFYFFIYGKYVQHKEKEGKREHFLRERVPLRQLEKN